MRERAHPLPFLLSPGVADRKSGSYSVRTEELSLALTGKALWRIGLVLFLSSSVELSLIAGVWGELALRA